MGRPKKNSPVYTVKLINWHNEVFEEFETRATDKQRIVEIIKGRKGSYIVEVWRKYIHGKLCANDDAPVRRFVWVDDEDYVRHEGKKNGRTMTSPEEAMQAVDLAYRSKYTTRQLKQIMDKGYSEDDARYIITVYMRKYRAEGKWCVWTSMKDDAETLKKMNSV